MPETAGTAGDGEADQRTWPAPGHTNSILLPWLARVLTRAQRRTLFALLYRNRHRDDHSVSGPMEVFVLLYTVGLAAALVAATWCWWAPFLALPFAVGSLYSNGVIMLYDILVRPDRHHDEHGPVVDVELVTRWALMSLFSVVQIVLAFAVLMLCAGQSFTPCLYQAPLSALYNSALTMTTLGYGDIVASGPWGKTIVLVELTFFVLILLTKLPIVIAGIRMSQHDRAPDSLRVCPTDGRHAERRPVPWLE